MIEILRFFQRFEAVIYFALGIGIIIYGWRFWLAWEEARRAIYGLERNAAQQRLNRSALMIFVLMMMGVVVFSLVTFIGPTLAPETVLFIPPTAETPAAGSEDGEAALGTATPLPTVAVSQTGCVPDQLFISSPTAGETVSGEVAITGTVQVPNFGFYKIEYARAQEELWLPIQAGRAQRVDEDLVSAWDTSNIPPGDYVLQLVVTDNAGQALPPCRIPIRISAGP
ncbi:MAG: hypothetical protein EPO32_02500 [Anaerolineae bacterium]|nr:MAG: hypothetical protein EPO32_02500 [Anaerolineae bacterium]